MVDTRRLAIVAVVGIVIVLLIGLAWWLSQERLSGYNTEVADVKVYREPTGIYAEYFTGEIVKTEFSVIGPKITVKKEANGQNKTFYLSNDAVIWLGLIIEDKGIKGDSSVGFDDLKKGQRVAVFIRKGAGNKSDHIHILDR